MLALQTNINAFRNLYNYNFKHFQEVMSFLDENERFLYQTGYSRVYYDNIGYGDLPIRMMGRDLKLQNFRIPNTYLTKVPRIKDYLNKAFELTTDEEIFIIQGTFESIELINDDTIPFMDPDIYTEITDDAIKSLFNKCAEQVTARETDRQDRDIIQHYRIYKAKAKHVIVILNTYPDSEQCSDFYLTYGLLPILYPDIKEALDDNELEFFKVLVQRSQVKRISNVAAQAAFEVLCNSEKYKTREREIKFKTLFKKMANSRIETARISLDRIANDIQNILRRYDEYLVQQSQLDILINKYETEKDSIISEFELAVKTTGVYDFDIYNNSEAMITFKVPISFFDTEEAELALKRRPDGVIKTLLSKLFIDQDAKLWIMSEAVFSFTENFREPGYISEDRIYRANVHYNPHIQYYRCLGDYKPQLIKAMRKGDLLMFINIMIASTKSINFKDGAVVNRWFETLEDYYSSNSPLFTQAKCIEKEGKFYTMQEYLDLSDEDNVEVESTLDVEEL